MPWLSSFKGYLQPRVLLIAGLGVLSGLPLGLLVDPLRYWLSEIGIEKSTIGLLSLVMLSYSLKMFWAPLVDRLRIPFLSAIGQRKSWLLMAQTLTFLCILLVGSIDPSKELNLFILFVLGISFFSATQDICVLMQCVLNWSKRKPSARPRRFTLSDIELELFFSRR